MNLLRDNICAKEKNDFEICKEVYGLNDQKCKNVYLSLLNDCLIKMHPFNFDIKLSIFKKKRYNF